MTVTTNADEIGFESTMPTEIPFTSVTILRADSTKVATIKAVATNDSMAASAPLPAPLPAGSYLVVWRTASRDGHAIRGTFGFSITP